MVGKGWGETLKLYVVSLIDKNHLETLKEKRKKRLSFWDSVLDYQYRMILHKGIQQWVRNVLQGSSNKKQIKKVESIIQCDINDFKKYLELFFSKGMNWNNYSCMPFEHSWVIDHVVPLFAMDYPPPNTIQFNKVWSYRNLQPMWSGMNYFKAESIYGPPWDGARKEDSLSPDNYYVLDNTHFEEIYEYSKLPMHCGTEPPWDDELPKKIDLHL